MIFIYNDVIIYDNRLCKLCMYQYNCKNQCHKIFSKNGLR